MLIYAPYSHAPTDVYQEKHCDLDSHWWEQKVAASIVFPTLPCFLVSLFFSLFWGEIYPSTNQFLLVFWSPVASKANMMPVMWSNTCINVWYSRDCTLFRLQVFCVGHWVFPEKQCYSCSKSEHVFLYFTSLWCTWYCGRMGMGLVRATFKMIKQLWSSIVLRWRYFELPVFRNQSQAMPAGQAVHLGWNLA